MRFCVLHLTGEATEMTVSLARFRAGPLMATGRFVHYDEFPEPVRASLGDEMLGVDAKLRPAEMPDPLVREIHSDKLQGHPLSKLSTASTTEAVAVGL